MSIYKGDTQITGVCKGDTEIIKAYRGTRVVYQKASGEEKAVEFTSLEPFTIGVASGKTWDGKIEYKSGSDKWAVWNGESSLNAVQEDGNYTLSFRGSNNTKITGSYSNYWTLSATSAVYSSGEIWWLLDYRSPENTIMSPNCFSYMFQNWNKLATVPSLPSTNISVSCYSYMFVGCSSLTSAPELPATTLADYCYRGMFSNCTSLTSAPALPADTLTSNCYNGMFYKCTSLTSAPALPANTLASNCYNQMFGECSSLISAPVLPADILANNCYSKMFYKCTSLTSAPALPATTLADYCYNEMFSSCSSLATLPTLQALTLPSYCYYQMFLGCKTKLSYVQDETYKYEFRIPSSGTGTSKSTSLTQMFANTGSTIMTPYLNTTYYVANQPVSA